MMAVLFALAAFCLLFAVGLYFVERGAPVSPEPDLAFLPLFLGLGFATIALVGWAARALL